jgi:hypothetical protein
VQQQSVSTAYNNGSFGQSQPWQARFHDVVLLLLLVILPCDGLPFDQRLSKQLIALLINCAS